MIVYPAILLAASLLIKREIKNFWFVQSRTLWQIIFWKKEAVVSHSWFEWPNGGLHVLA